MQRKELLKILFELFLDLPRMNRFIDGANSFGLTPFEIGLLLEISASPNLSVKNFLDFYSNDRTLLDRSVLALSKLNFIKFKQSKLDKRERYISITNAGLKALKKLDDLFDELIVRFRKYGSESQLRSVVELYKLIADNLGQKQRPIRPAEHQYRCQQRRVTRALKLHDKKWFGSDLNAQSIQILAQLFLEIDEQTPTELGDTFSIATPLLQLTLRTLFQKGLVSISAHSTDKRKKFVSITGRGKQEFFQTQNKAIELLSKATNQLSDSDLKKYIQDFNFFLRGINQINQVGIKILPFSEKINFKKLALKMLVKNNQSELLPTRFLSDEDKIALFYFKNIVIGFAQFEVVKIDPEKLGQDAAKSINITINFIDKKYKNYAEQVRSSLIWKFNKLYSRKAVVAGLL